MTNLRAAVTLIDQDVYGVLVFNEIGVLRLDDGADHKGYTASTLRPVLRDRYGKSEVEIVANNLAIADAQRDTLA